MRSSPTLAVGRGGGGGVATRVIIWREKAISKNEITLLGIKKHF